MMWTELLPYPGKFRWWSCQRFKCRWERGWWSWNFHCRIRGFVDLIRARHMGPLWPPSETSDRCQHGRAVEAEAVVAAVLLLVVVAVPHGHVLWELSRAFPSTWRPLCCQNSLVYFFCSFLTQLPILEPRMKHLSQNLTLKRINIRMNVCGPNKRWWSSWRGWGTRAGGS